LPVPAVEERRRLSIRRLTEEEDAMDLVNAAINNSEELGEEFSIATTVNATATTVGPTATTTVGTTAPRATTADPTNTTTPKPNKPDFRQCYAKSSCRDKLKNAAECPKRTADSKKSDFFDKETCCPKCRPKQSLLQPQNKKPINDLKKDLKATVARFCPKDKLERCKQDMPECFDEERPSFMNGVCCGSCVRKDSKKRLVDVVKGNKPAPVKNEDGCDKATCPAGKKRCIRAFSKGSHKFSQNVFKCVTKKHKKLIIKARKALKDAEVVKDIKSFLKNATDSEAHNLVLELINRVCDNPDFEAVCDKHQEFVARYLVAKVSRPKSNEEDDKDEELIVDLDLPVPAVEERRRLSIRRLTEDEDAMDLVNAAINNSEELGEEFSIEDDAAVPEIEPEIDAPGTGTKADPQASHAASLTISATLFAFVALL
jgi:hypothetical protein